MKSKEITATLHPLPGDHSVVAPPVPIPNTEVKRNRADGSVILSCKSRSSPGSLPYKPSVGRQRVLFIWNVAVAAVAAFSNRSSPGSLPYKPSVGRQRVLFILR